MTSVTPYLNFGGRCREAMNFYKACFNAEQLIIQTFAEAGQDVPAPFQHSIMHSMLKSDGVVLMASDGQPGAPVMAGNNVTLSLHFSDQQEQDRIFNALATSGTVTLPLQDAPWGARFGMLTDQFGIHWMFNHEKQAA